MTPQETFVTRLRRHRQRNGISLDEMATDTRVKRALLEALEQNDLSEWPRGLYARAWIRAYATAVGLDPIDTVDEFCRLFPQGDRRANSTIKEIASIVASESSSRLCRSSGSSTFAAASCISSGDRRARASPVSARSP